MGKYSNNRVVLKKLAHTNELMTFDQFNRTSKIIKETDLYRLFDNLNNFKLCNLYDRTVFLNYIENFYNNYELWTILQINIEPILLKIANNNWPVPKLYGSCGRLIVEQYCGNNLNDFVDYNWYQRLHLAKQLLEAAINFTDKHPNFRLYLTDISPDNIVVDSNNFNVYFIDLENAVLTSKVIDNSDNWIHISRYFDDEIGFVFNQEEICSAPKSDHNIYAICQLILSENAPWPMMVGGLLHSPPFNSRDLFDLIDSCVVSHPNWTRFQIADKLLERFNRILKENRINF